MQEVNVAGPAP